MSSAVPFLAQLVRDTHKPEAEVIALATEAGLRQLWREHVLGQYLRGDIERQQAIESVGIDWVEMAEKQHHAMAEDVEWGLNKTSQP
jgi:hypothetical protein